jgi:glycosyltransferase involved in cell wall biosynthesis
VSSALSMRRYWKGLLLGLSEAGVPGVRTWYDEGTPSGFWNKYLGYFFKALQVKEGCNIVLSERFSFLLFALTNDRSLVICHDMIALLNPSLSAFRKMRYRLSLRWMNKAKVIVCISESTKKDLIGLNTFIDAAKVKVIYNGIEPFWFNDSAVLPHDKGTKGLSGTRYFLMVGTDAWNKNTILALKAMHAPGVVNDYILVKVGPLSLQNREFAKQAGILARIVEFKNVSDDELKWLYKHAVALLFPSLHEGFGWPPLEAMACGCPVIASNVSSVPEVCGEAALYINPADAGSLRSAMEAILLNEDKRVEMIRRGRDQAGNFSWKKTTGELMSVIESIKK